MFGMYVLCFFITSARTHQLNIVSSKCPFRDMYKKPVDSSNIAVIEQVPIQASCMIKCDRTKNCVSFVYNEILKSCSLYDSSAGVHTLEAGQKAVVKLLEKCEYMGPRSCQESVIAGNKHTGIHHLDSPDGANYTAFCQFNVDGTGVTFLSRSAADEMHLDLKRLSATHDHAVIRFMKDNIQTEAVVRQLPAYRSTSVAIVHNVETGYAATALKDDFGSTFLYLAFLPSIDANTPGSTQGMTSNNIDVTFINCDGNPNNYVAFYANINNAVNRATLGLQFVPNLMATATTVPLKNYLTPEEEFHFTAEFHMGGCGDFSTSQAYGLQGMALGIPF